MSRRRHPPRTDVAQRAAVATACPTQPTLKNEENPGDDHEPSKPTRKRAAPDHEQPGGESGEAAEHVPDTVERVRHQVQRVRQPLIVVRRVRGQLRAEQAGYPDIADRMEGDKHNSAERNQRGEAPAPICVLAQKAVQPPSVDREPDGIHDGQVGDHQQPLAMLVKPARDLKRRVILSEANSGRDSRFRHQRDDEHDAAQPGIPPPTALLIVPGSPRREVA